MPRLPIAAWIGNAAAVLLGRFGDIARQARQVGCSRQAAYRHAAQVQQAVAQARATRPAYEELLRDNQRLAEENRQLWQALQDTIDLPESRQRRFAATAAACGVSLSTTLVLLAVLLGARAPSRATVGRWVADASHRATGLLARLDAACRDLVTALCLDEIFCRRRPILVGVEPQSLACVMARRADDRSGTTWAAALAPWGRLERAVADGGTGLRKGLELFRSQRQQAGPAPPLLALPDLFHPARDAQRALRQVWAAAEAAWRRHDRKRAAFDRVRRQLGWRHTDYHPAQVQASSAWMKARAAYERAEAQEAAWRRARGAFEVFRPDGELNDRSWAAAEIAAARPGLKGAAWSKVRGFLSDERALNFLDVLHRDLAAAEPRAELRQALAQLWRLRQQHRGREAVSAVAVLEVPLQEVVCAKQAGDWRASYRRVARVLGRVVRASSVVECMNSVWRMHQSRHRKLTQGLLDLKRLWWNVRAFRSGKRKGKCPYEWLGLRLPTYELWDLLQRNPEELTQQVSTQEIAE
jgi:hypothetical protein